MKKMKKMKEGAASFYVVVFATLILMVVVVSFAAVIASEITKSSNDDLSQSAYDSAMAGIEDAKLAYYDYKNCLSQGAVSAQPNNDGTVSCNEIVWYMEASETEYADLNLDKCNMVSYILGRSDNEITETNTVSNNMQQEYTCVNIDDSLGDYRATLSSSDTTKVVKVKFDGVNAQDIEKVKISWYTDEGIETNYRNFKSSGVTFASQADTPPTISVALLQTASNFSISDFDVRQGDYTDRGMVYLVPTDNETDAQNSKDGNYIGAYNGHENYIAQSGFLESNDKTVQNNPYAVYCDDENAAGNEFLCSATIQIPEPIGGVRNDNTFVFVIGLPYGKPVTDFALEFYCADERACAVQNIEDNSASTSSNKANLKGVQVEIDSTGRANDLYRRLETRLEDNSGYSLSIFGPLELLGSLENDNAFSLKKQLTVTSEYNF